MTRAKLGDASVAFRVEDEGSELARVEVGMERAEEKLVELESSRELSLNLSHAIEELMEHGRRLLEMRGRTAGELLLNRCKEGSCSPLGRRGARGGAVEIVVERVAVIGADSVGSRGGGSRGRTEDLVGREMPASIEELVTKREPVLFDEDLEPLERPVERVEADLRDSSELSSSIPTVGAVDENMGRVDVHVADDDVGT